MKRFEGKVALVTGAASGIGFATAQRLAREGASVLGCDISPQLQQQMETLAAEGLTVKAQTLNVADDDSCQQAIDAAIAAFGRLDVLCNIAGILLHKKFIEMSRAEWDRVIAVNLSGVMVMSQKALPHLLKTTGNIVNIASTAGIVGLSLNAAYCASKGGVVLLSKSLAVDLAETGVRVNAVAPGGIMTPLAMNVTLPEDANSQLFMRATPLTPYFGQPEDIAAGVAYLASADAKFVTGSVLTIDGGQTTI